MPLTSAMTWAFSEATRGSAGCRRRRRRLRRLGRLLAGLRHRRGERDRHTGGEEPEHRLSRHGDPPTLDRRCAATRMTVRDWRIIALLAGAAALGDVSVTVTETSRDSAGGPTIVRMGVSSAAELLNLMGVLTGAALCAMLLALVLRGRAGGDRDDAVAAADRRARPGLEPRRTGRRPAEPRRGHRPGSVAQRHLIRRARHPGRGGRPFGGPADSGTGAPSPRSRRRARSAPWPCTCAPSRPASFAPHRPPSRMLTAAFGAISVPLAIATRRQTNGRRALWMLALALFAVSATHLGHFHDETGGWLAELSATTPSCRWPSPSSTRTTASRWPTCSSSRR